MQISDKRPSGLAASRQDRERPANVAGPAGPDRSEARAGSPAGIPPSREAADPLVAEFVASAREHVDQLRKLFWNIPGEDGVIPAQDPEPDKNRKQLIVSDVLDKNGHQYVNLVQKGGGVLGIALVGYTYILEKAGIRFLRMAGTSAGAINTALITAIGDPADPKAGAKSEKLLNYLSKLEMFSFVDGHPFAKWLIRNIISDKNFSKRITLFTKVLLGVLGFFLVSCIVLLGLRHRVETDLQGITLIAFIGSGLSILVIATALIYLSRMLERLKDSGYGINPGHAFLAWISDALKENAVHSIDDLNTKAATLPGSLYLRTTGQPLSKADIKGDVSFITSELVSQNKIELPKMCALFRGPHTTNPLHPGEFVRASMSIPFFFESYMISDIERRDPAVQAAWKEYFGCGPESIPETVRFVDGGVLSNFPINIFYNPSVPEARLPSFGIDLDDAEPDKSPGRTAASWSLGSYCGRMLNTIRYYYDKDFLLQNRMFQRGVGKVILYGKNKAGKERNYNWLDFFLSDKTKLELFLDGAGSATEFLAGFDWEKYKEDRRTTQSMLHTEAARVAAPKQS